MRKTVILAMVLPMAAMLAACGSSGDASSEQTVAQLFSSEARAEGTVAPAPPQTFARGRGLKEKTKILVGRTASPAGSEAAVTPCPTPPDAAASAPCPSPAETPDAARRGGPKGGGRDKILTN